MDNDSTNYEKNYYATPQIVQLGIFSPAFLASLNFSTEDYNQVGGSQLEGFESEYGEY